MRSRHHARLEIVNGTPLIFPVVSAGRAVLRSEMVDEIIDRGRRERERRAIGCDNDAKIAFRAAAKAPLTSRAVRQG